jgi:hypothetical protein
MKQNLNILQSQQWLDWLEQATLPPSPKNLAQASKENLKDWEDSEFPPEKQDIKDTYDPQQQRIWESWQQNLPLYDPRHLYLHTRNKQWYGQWCRSLGLTGDLLTFNEYWFLSNHLSKTHDLPKIDPKTYRHPVPPGQYKKPTKSRIGNMYRDWLIVDLADGTESERDYPLYYKVVCKACGFQHNKFNYSRIAHPCSGCLKLQDTLKIQSVKLEKEPVKLPKPLTLWKTNEGWILQDLAPANALYKLVIKTAGEPYQEELATLDDLAQSVQQTLVRPASRSNDTETLFTPSIEGTETLPNQETLQEEAEPEPQPRISQLIKDLPSI